jgi:hypothetical protein
MAKRTAAQVYQDLIGQGLPADAAMRMVAIAEAESGLDDASRGDLGLQDSFWGPSFGTYQIRTVKSQTGTGTDRDIAWLAASDTNQAKAAYDISSGGRNLTPWSTFNTGAYQQYLGQAQTAAAATPAGNPYPTWGPSWLPWNWPSDAGNAVAGQINQELGGARTIVIEAGFVILGLALIGAGLAKAVAPKLRTAAKTAAKAAVIL